MPDAPSTSTIQLHYTVSATAGDQQHHCDITLSLPADANEETIAALVHRATLGVRLLSHEIATAMSPASPPDGATPVPSRTLVPAHNGAGSAGKATPPPAPLPPSPSPVPSQPSPPAPAGRFVPATAPALLKAAREYGHDIESIRTTLGVTALDEITDFGDALEKLKRTPPVESRPIPIGGFAEESGEYDPTDDDEEALAEELGLLAEQDDGPDFGPLHETMQNDAFAPEASQPGVSSRPSRDDAARQRLQTLRAVSLNTAAASAEDRKLLANTVITTLGKDQAAALIEAIWHPDPGTRLNIGQTRALIDWFNHDEHFNETATAVIALDSVEE